MVELVVALLTWIALATGLDRPPPPPVLLVSRDQITELASGRTDVRGLYDRDLGTIYIRDDWMPSDLRSRASLLHELVHHVQAFNAIEKQCPAELEPQAYELTHKWLREQGSAEPYKLLETDELTIKIRSICPEDRGFAH